MNIHKTLVLSIVTVLALVLTAVSAEAMFPPSPYTGVNTIGTVWQEQYVPVFGGYAGSYYSQYSYPFAARTGGFYGDTTAFTHGLRPGFYAPVAPVRMTRYYQPVMQWPYTYTGYAGGYGRATSQHPIVVAP